MKGQLFNMNGKILRMNGLSMMKGIVSEVDASENEMALQKIKTTVISTLRFLPK